MLKAEIVIALGGGALADWGGGPWAAAIVFSVLILIAVMMEVNGTNDMIWQVYQAAQSQERGSGEHVPRTGDSHVPSACAPSPTSLSMVDNDDGADNIYILIPQYG